MGDLLLRVAEQLAEDVPARLPNDLNVIYFPQIGFLITMPMDAETGGALWEGPEDDPWERMFSTDLIVYYKNNDTREMDERFGDVYGDICGASFRLSDHRIRLTCLRRPRNRDHSRSCPAGVGI